MPAAVLTRSCVKLSFLCDHTHPGDKALQTLDELDISETA